MICQIAANGITIVHDRRNAHRLPRILFIELPDLWARFLAPSLGLGGRP